jgi:hypothetical protein
MLIDPCEFISGQFNIAGLGGKIDGNNCGYRGKRDTTQND